MSTDVAVGWLTALSPSGPWFLYAADSTGVEPGLPVRRFTLNQLDEMRAWIAARLDHHNLYYSPNTPLPTITKHPTKAEITYLNFLHVDLDLPKSGPHTAPTEENFARLLRRLRAMVPAPHLIVFSGGGYQGLWRLANPLPAGTHGERVEAVNQAIEHALTGDHCWNINRILRLPGTVNSPDAKKLAKHPGRVPTPTTVVSADWDARWSFERDAVPRLDLVEDDEIEEDNDENQPSSSHALTSLPKKYQAAITTGDAKAYDNDRSKLVWFVVTYLVRKGWTDAEITPFILDPAYPLSGHCRSQRTPARAAQRQLDRARAAISRDWVRNEMGQVLPNHPPNIRRGIDLLGIRFSYDSFAAQPYVNGSGPLRPLTDQEANSFRVNAFVETHVFTPGKEIWFDVIGDLAWKASYHPVLDYLADVQTRWDGVQRLDNWLFAYGNVGRKEENDLYNRYVSAAGRLMLVAAVRRVREPGSKFDEMMVFVNPIQGTDKSQALAILAVNKDWFIDSLPLHAKDQEVIEKLSGKWLVEFAEMNGLRTSAVEHLKAFLSRDTDHARMAYGRFTNHPKRQCVFFGSTNEPSFLRDTEDRRFWPIRVGRFDLVALRRDRDQLWAEAALAEARGESIRLDKSLWEAAAEVQAEHRIEDPWVATIEDAFGNFTGRVTSSDAWKVIGKPHHQRTQEDNRRFGVAMRVAGWERKQFREAGRPQWFYARGTQDERERHIYVFVDPVVRDSPPLVSYSEVPDDGERYPELTDPPF